MQRAAPPQQNADLFGFTAVVAALPEEVAPLRLRLASERRIEVGACELSCGQLAGTPVALAVTGDGPALARAGIQALFDAVVVHRLLVVGVSGALGAGLCLEDLVVGERLVDETTGVELRTGGALLSHVERVTGARRGVLVSARRIADTPQEKQRLLGRYAPGIGVAAVDLESCVYARLAEEARVPWLCLRAVSDAAGERLPALLERSRGVSGSVSRSRVVLGMLREPRRIPALWQLRGRVARCALRLARAVEALLLAGAAPAWSLPCSGVPVHAGSGYPAAAAPTPERIR
jgi:adenosylhomocysteine nucleosidase